MIVGALVRSNLWPAILLFSMLSLGSAAAQGADEIRGFAFDPEGKPLVGATVHFSNPTTTKTLTDANGAYVLGVERASSHWIAFGEPPPDERMLLSYWRSCDVPRCEPPTVNGTSWYNFTFDRGGRVSGEVVSTFGRPFAQHDLYFQSRGPFEGFPAGMPGFHGETDEAGHFDVLLRPGWYRPILPAGAGPCPFFTECLGVRAGETDTVQWRGGTQMLYIVLLVGGIVAFVFTRRKKSESHPRWSATPMSWTFVTRPIQYVSQETLSTQSRTLHLEVVADLLISSRRAAATRLLSN